MHQHQNLEDLEMFSEAIPRIVNIYESERDGVEKHFETIKRHK